MRYSLLLFWSTAVLTTLPACNFGWRHTEGVVVLSKVQRSDVLPAGLPQTGSGHLNMPASWPVSLVLPEGWHWTVMGDYFFATREGVFLQNIIVERIRIGQTVRNLGLFPTAFSPGNWPVQIVDFTRTPFRSGMSPRESADVVLTNRRNDQRIIDLDVQSVDMQTVAGVPGFKTVYDFKLTVQERMTAYRAVCYGFMLDGSFYGITYTAARRYYYERDTGNFESVMQSFRVLKK